MRDLDQLEMKQTYQYLKPLSFIEQLETFSYRISNNLKGFEINLLPKFIGITLKLSGHIYDKDFSIIVGCNS